MLPTRRSHALPATGPPPGAPPGPDARPRRGPAPTPPHSADGDRGGRLRGGRRRRIGRRRRRRRGPAGDEHANHPFDGTTRHRSPYLDGYAARAAPLGRGAGRGRPRDAGAGVGPRPRGPRGRARRTPRDPRRRQPPRRPAERLGAPSRNVPRPAGLAALPDRRRRAPVRRRHRVRSPRLRVRLAGPARPGACGLPPLDDPVTGLLLRGQQLLVETGHDQTYARRTVRRRVRTPARPEPLPRPACRRRPSSPPRRVGRWTRTAPARPRPSAPPRVPVHVRLRDRSDPGTLTDLELALPQPTEHIVSLDGDEDGDVVVGVRLLRRGGDAGRRADRSPGGHAHPRRRPLRCCRPYSCAIRPSST